MARESPSPSNPAPIRGSARSRTLADRLRSGLALVRKWPRTTLAAASGIAAVLLLQVVILRSTIEPALAARQRTEVQPMAMLLHELWLLEGLPAAVARMCASPPGEPEGAAVEMRFEEIPALLAERPLAALQDLQSEGVTIDDGWTVRYRCNPPAIEIEDGAGERFWPPRPRR